MINSCRASGFLQQSQSNSKKATKGNRQDLPHDMVRQVLFLEDKWKEI